MENWGINFYIDGGSGGDVGSLWGLEEPEADEEADQPTHDIYVKTIG